MLYLVATPIGNLDDISLRAIKVLNQCDYILCEDTRHSKKLTNHYKIATPLLSFHKFSEARKEEKVILDLKNQKEIALISDAGTPGIADPGERLVRRCIEETIPITAIPGPCSIIQALICSGLNTEPFQFIGFLPRKENERKYSLENAINFPGTTICLETPKRLTKTLQAIEILDPETYVVVARELTKKFEEFFRGPIHKVLSKFSHSPPKGELIILVQGRPKKVDFGEESSIPEHVFRLQKEKSLSLKEAIKEVAFLRGMSKREVYNLMHNT